MIKRGSSREKERKSRGRGRANLALDKLVELELAERAGVRDLRPFHDANKANYNIILEE